MSQTQSEKIKVNRLNIFTKVLTPIIVGSVIGFVGYLSNKTLAEISSRQESARLITELQVKREQSESELRKDIFNQTLKTFLLENSKPDTIQDYSKQLLRLELLALNFGDSLSLSPLFHELNRDLDQLAGTENVKGIEKLKKRLKSLSHRVASRQLASVSQHGKVIQVWIPLKEAMNPDDCLIAFKDTQAYKWPDDAVKAEFGSTSGLEEVLEQEILERKKVELNGIARNLSMTFSEVDVCNEQIQVSLSIDTTKRDSNDAFEIVGYDSSVYREFSLDFFNFPKVDNTRLGSSQRFAIMIDSIYLAEDPHILLTSVIFPAEYASMRDAPSMDEALKMLEYSFAVSEKSLNKL